MRRLCYFWIILCAGGAIVAADAARAGDTIDFARDVAPIFAQHCIRCHKPGNEKGGLSLATSAGLTANSYLQAGQPDESYLLDVVTPGADQRPAMPKEGNPLAAEEVARLRRWIAEGAKWPESVVIREKAKADASWWSLQPLTAAEPPASAEIPASRVIA